MLTIDTSRPDAEVAAAWIECTARSNPEGAPSRESDTQHFDLDDDWGAQALLEIVCEEPDRALEITFLIARMTDDSWLLCNLGAGPIESLLAHDGTLLDAVAIEAQNSPNLKVALGSAWQNAMSEATWQAVQRLASR
ncbi:MAG TPA: hypothetical protein VG248_02255 [Caulobacteraceae bacterium]|jgi:hypothetical protein|nr:hypothetical protein [Caulobacteraceae bacterium]